MKISKQLMNAPVLGSALGGLGKVGKTLGQLGSRVVHSLNGRAPAPSMPKASQKLPQGWQQASATPQPRKTVALGKQRTETVALSAKKGFVKLDRVPEPRQYDAAGKPLYTANATNAVIRAASDALHNAQLAADKLQAAKPHAVQSAKADYKQHYGTLLACMQDLLRCAASLDPKSEKIHTWQEQLNKLPQSPKFKGNSDDGSLAHCVALLNEVRAELELGR